jgi:hypothetical protein
MNGGRQSFISMMSGGNDDNGDDRWQCPICWKIVKRVCRNDLLTSTRHKPSDHQSNRVVCDRARDRWKQSAREEVLNEVNVISRVVSLVMKREHQFSRLMVRD